MSGIIENITKQNSSIIIKEVVEKQIKFIEEAIKTREVNPKKRINYPKHLDCANCEQQIKYTTMTWGYYKDLVTGKFEKSKQNIFDVNKLFVCVPCAKENGFPETREARPDSDYLYYMRWASLVDKVRKEFGGKCIIAGTSKKLQVAHIKPRKKCNDECKWKCTVDENNAILLSFPLHRLFDLKLFSFSDEGKVLISKQMSEADRKKLFDPEKVYIKGININEKRKKYLEFHRKEIKNN